MTTNTTTSLDFNYEITQLKCDNQSHIPANKWMIKAWLPLAFEGFDAELIESFISKHAMTAGLLPSKIYLMHEEASS